MYACTDSYRSLARDTGAGPHSARKALAPDPQLFCYAAAERHARLPVGHHDTLPPVVEDGDKAADTQAQAQEAAR